MYYFHFHSTWPCSDHQTQPATSRKSKSKITTISATARHGSSQHSSNNNNSSNISKSTIDRTVVEWVGGFDEMNGWMAEWLNGWLTGWLACWLAKLRWTDECCGMLAWHGVAGWIDVWYKGEWMFILFSFLLIFIFIVFKLFSRVQVFCWRVTQNLKIIFLRHLHLRHLQTQHISLLLFKMKSMIAKRVIQLLLCMLSDPSRHAMSLE